MGHVIFDAFADPTWRDIDDEWIRGEIPTSERARRQFALVHAREHEFQRLIDKQAIDPAFAPLVADLRDHGIPAQVVSDGFDAYVKPMLARAGLSYLPFQSNRLFFRNGSIKLEFPHERPGHDPRGGWKAGPVRLLQAQGWRVAYAGDGMSDWAAARAADLLFARSQLADRCKLDGIPYHAFNDMRDIHDWLRANLLHVLAPGQDPMTFRQLAEVFERIDAVSGRNAMIEILAELYRRATPEEAAQVTYLMQGRLVPKFEDLEFGMASRLLLRSIAQAFEVKPDEVQAAFREAGDLGLTAEALTPAESITATPPLPRGWGLATSREPRRSNRPRNSGKGRIFWQTAVGNPSWRASRQLELAQDLARNVSVGGVFARLREVAEAEGAESQERKVAGIANLLRDLDPRSNRYLPRIPVGRLRLGIGDPTFMDALSFARVGDKSDRKAIERAYNLTCDLGKTARDYLRGGADAMARAKVQVGNPVRMAQAARMSSGQEIVDKIGSAAVEPKLDGFRVQIHRDGDRVRIYSRNLEDMSRMFPDVSQAARVHLKKPRVIIEGEAMGVNPENGEFLPFQVTTSRRRRHGIETAAKEIPLHVHAFDLLYDGDNVIELPFTERRHRLEEIIENDAEDLQVSECIITDDPEAIDVFFNEQVHAGFEGVMAKRLDSVYQAGQRNFNWIKYKASYSSALTDTLDCVLIGYWRGQGKRTPWGIGALLSAVWDAEEQVFKSIARIGTGYSDEEWVRIREKLDEIAVADRPANVHSDVVPDVWASPEIVVEVLADELTRSPMHVAGRTDDELGLALRFPRVIGFVREDKSPTDATTVTEVRDLFARQGGSS